MAIELAKRFLEVVSTGSFMCAAGWLNISCSCGSAPAIRWRCRREVGPPADLIDHVAPRPGG